MHRIRAMSHLLHMCYVSLILLWPNICVPYFFCQLLKLSPILLPPTICVTNILGFTYFTISYYMCHIFSMCCLFYGHLLYMSPIVYCVTYCIVACHISHIFPMCYILPLLRPHTICANYFVIKIYFSSPKNKPCEKKIVDCKIILLYSSKTLLYS